MGKVWVLDTETKGTGAEMVPLEKAHGAASRGSAPVVVRDKPQPKPRTPASRGPRSFKVVDAMTRQVLAEHADARETVKLLEPVRSIVDVSIYVWDEPAEEWRRLTLGEQRKLWELRGRQRDGGRADSADSASTTATSIESSSS